MRMRWEIGGGKTWLLGKLMTVFEFRNLGTSRDSSALPSKRNESAELRERRAIFSLPNQSKVTPKATPFYRPASPLPFSFSFSLSLARRTSAPRPPSFQCERNKPILQPPHLHSRTTNHKSLQHIHWK